MDNIYPVNWNECVTEWINKPYDNYKTIIRPYQPLLVLVGAVTRAFEEKTKNYNTLTEMINTNDLPINYFIKLSMSKFVTTF